MNRMAFLLRHLRFALLPGAGLYFPNGRAMFLRNVFRWSGAAYGGDRVPVTRPQRVTAVLLSYKRPWNMEGLVRACLACDCIDHVIVSNNNPSVDINRWLPIRHERLSIVSQDRRRPAGMAVMIAAHSHAQFFISIDDDLLLSPRQIHQLCERLFDHPSVLHGVVGQVLPSGASRFDMHVTGEREVDVLNRAYAYTADHAQRYREILTSLGRASDEQQIEMPFGSDIVLSFCGLSKPHIHDVGPLLSCPTAALQGIARFKDAGFDAFRAALFRDVQNLTRPARAA